MLLRAEGFARGSSAAGGGVSGSAMVSTGRISSALSIAAGMDSIFFTAAVSRSAGALFSLAGSLILLRMMIGIIEARMMSR